MQIRLTVLGPQSGRTARAFDVRACDVLVTAPAGTALAVVASGLAKAVGGTDGPAQIYAGSERLDPQRCVLGEPPLVDGAVLSLHSPAEPAPSPEGAAARLHVVAGPDAGGVHLLHGGRVTIGRSADADVPLDDPDVSRLHCAVTVGDDGRVSVADLNSTNGTTVDGRPVTDQPVRFSPGALLRIGESTLRLTPVHAETTLPTSVDGEGQLRVTPAAAAAQVAPVWPGPHPSATTGPGYGSAPWATRSGEPSHGHAPYGYAHDAVPGPRGHDGSGADPARVSGAGAPPGTSTTGSDTDALRRAGAKDLGGAPNPARTPGPGAPRGTKAEHLGEGADSARTPGTGAPPRTSTTGSGTGARERARAEGLGGAASAARTTGSGPLPGTSGTGSVTGAEATPAGDSAQAPERPGAEYDTGALDPDAADGRGAAGPGAGRAGTPTRGTTVPRQMRRRGGLTAWARRLTGARDETRPDDPVEPVAWTAAPEDSVADAWPDPAALLLTALGPGPRLWERDRAHQEALALRLGTTDRPTPDGMGLLPVVPVTVRLREAGSLGLAGPRNRLAGLARSALAQLAALHSPTDVEIVLISTDRGRALDERTAEWSWLGWLPHLRPGHGQDCRLLLAYDREQAAARTGELLRRLDEHLQTSPPASPLPHVPPGAPDRLAPAPAPPPAPAPYAGPYAVVVVDGDPGSAALRDAVTRLAADGAGAGIHVVCLAETPAASPASPVTATYEAACAASPAFRACGAVALLSGDVATALRLLRTSRGRPVGHGTLASVDAVSVAWAERFARALAPLRTAEPGDAHAHVSAPLPQAARLLDELGLARATPASLMARWAAAVDDPQALGGRAWAVLGAGPRGPVCADLVAQGPHLLVEGPAGSGRTELLRSAAAALAAADRPDRLALVLVDGAGSGRGDGLRACTDLPHVTTHLTADDPVRMREFAQALTAELKRRGELVGRLGFAEWHTQRAVSGRMIAQRTRTLGTGGSGPVPPTTPTAPTAPAPPAPQPGPGAGAGDLDSPGSATLKLRPGNRSPRAQDVPPLPRLVVLVDDIDALVAPALGATGRPSAGSVVRALEAVVHGGERLGVHLVAATAHPERTAATAFDRGAALRITLDAPSAAPEDPAPGRGRLYAAADGRVTAFQAGRVTGRIPRTSTLRPTAVPLEWERMGDPPARRPVRELGNGPTDLALLASALERAARSVEAPAVPPLLETHAK
ncbi:FHA domain-containing protein [Streptomyces apocyni]|uniref:FHA domain-containing protein n=1 Tax=Streptomyces apocyni TaxID=2654677 RepID=UPI0012EA5E98|nr:FHA domain-containing protein [Streptomyces apocyni]